jgi:hypothetical protein
VKGIFRTVLGLLLGLVSLLPFSGCGMDSRLAGSEVTNPPQKQTLSGRVFTHAKAIAPDIKVQAYPMDFDPIADSALADAIKGSLRLWSDTTDSMGIYNLIGLDTSLFNVWGVNAKDGNRFLIRDQKPDTLRNKTPVNSTLENFGALSILIQDSLPTTKAYVYLEGTPLENDLHSLVSEVGTVLLDSVASGLTPKLYHKVRGPLGVRTLLAENIMVRPGDTVPVGIFRSWQYSKRVFINTSVNGSVIAKTVKEFPLLVRLDKTNFNFSQAQLDGGDLRFSRKDGKPLAFEMEVWDKSLSQGLVWVKLDSILGADSAQFIRMYWGRPDALPASKGAEVFTSQANYAGVWHYQTLGAGSPPLGAGSPPEIADASAAGNTGYVNDYPGGVFSVGAVIGNGLKQNGLPNELYSTKTYTNPGYVTLSLWFRTTTDSGGLLIGFNRLQKRVDSASERDRQIWMDSTGRINFGVVEELKPGYQKHVISSAVSYNDGKWHNVVGMISSEGMALYLDNQKVATDTTATSGQNYTGYWRVGSTYRLFDWVPALYAWHFQGEFDEVRVALQPFTEDWLKLSFENQKPSSTMIRFDPD